MTNLAVASGEDLKAAIRTGFLAASHSGETPEQC